MKDKEITIKQYGYENGRQWIMLSDGRIFKSEPLISRAEITWEESNSLEDLKAYLASEGKE